MDNHLAWTADLLRDIKYDAIKELAGLVWFAPREHKRVFVCGNGGSAATANHFAEDVCLLAKPLNVRMDSLCANLPYILAIGNDCGFEHVFSKQLEGTEGHILVSISCSGNSPNVLKAMEYTNKVGGTNFALGGCHGGKLAKLAHKSLVVPSDDFQCIEDIHMVIVHTVIKELINYSEAMNNATE